MNACLARKYAQPSALLCPTWYSSCRPWGAGSGVGVTTPARRSISWPASLPVPARGNAGCRWVQAVWHGPSLSTCQALGGASHIGWRMRRMPCCPMWLHQLAACVLPAKLPCLPCAKQVASSAGVSVGRWVRLYAVKPSGIAPYRRRLLEEALVIASAPAAAPAPARQPLAEAAAGPASAAHTPGPGPAESVAAEFEVTEAVAGGRRRRYRPLPPGLREVRREARRLGLNEPEHGGMQDNSTDGSGATVPALQAAGTLDVSSGDPVRWLAMLVGCGRPQLHKGA